MPFFLPLQTGQLSQVTKLNIKYMPPEHPYRCAVFNLVYNKNFDWVIMCIIGLNIATMCMQHKDQVRVWGFVCMMQHN